MDVNEADVIEPVANDNNLIDNQAEDHNPPVINAEEALMEAAAVGCWHRVLPYCGCIFLSLSQLGQMVLIYFGGRAGEAAAEQLDQAAQIGAIMVHELADDRADSNFYDNREDNNELARRFPEIEANARGISEVIDTYIGYSNVATQFILTGRSPVTVHDLLLGVQFFLVLRLTMGAQMAPLTMMFVQGAITSSGIARNMPAPPTAVVASSSNAFFDWLSDTVIRQRIIYRTVDTLEGYLNDHFPIDDHNNDGTDWGEQYLALNDVDAPNTEQPIATITSSSSGNNNAMQRRPVNREIDSDDDDYDEAALVEINVANNGAFEQIIAPNTFASVAINNNQDVLSTRHSLDDDWGF